MRMTRLNQIIDSIWSDRLYGTSGDDYVELTWGNDTIYGGNGNDAIWDLDGHWQNQFPGGGPGDAIWMPSDDLIYGGDGDDVVFAGLGADGIYGGRGFDKLDYRYSKSGVEVNLILGRGYGDDRSASRGDIISGFEMIVGSSHDDLFFLGAQPMIITGGIYENNGNDRFYGGSGAATIYGGGGDDTVFAGSGAIEFWGGEGHDTLSFALSTTGRSQGVSAEQSIETMTGSAHGDRLSAMVEWGKHVTLRGEGGDDSLLVGIPVYGIGGAGSLYGGTGNDTLTGGRNADWLDGGSGNDTIFGASGDDMILGGSGDDSLNGGSGRDALFGGDGNDRIAAGGGPGDRLYGGNGNDILIADRDSATLFGEAGADQFVFSPGPGAASGTQRISDFQRGLDRIDVSRIDARPFSSVDPGTHGDQAFLFTGAAGKSAPAGSLDYRFVGSDTVVRLHTNSDGIADYQIVLTGHHHLSASDFLL